MNAQHESGEDMERPRTGGSRHFDVLVLAVIGTPIRTRVGAPLGRWRHALVSAFQRERAAVALRRELTRRSCGSPPAPCSSTALGRGWGR